MEQKDHSHLDSSVSILYFNIYIRQLLLGTPNR